VTSGRPPISERPDRGAFELVHVEPHLVIASCGPVHLTHYRGPLTLPLLELADGHHQKLIRLHGRTAVFGVIEPGLPIPSADVRARSTALIEQNGAHVAAAALMLPGDGFWVSAARSVITASFFLARQPYPSKCFGEVHEAAKYAVDALGARGPLTADVTRAAQAMRDAH
jgi:hypothetical protein